MHTKGYVALCMHCRPMVEGDSVTGMQWIQKANSGLKVAEQSFQEPMPNSR